jgi:catechol 2,3-dioxygenase-like lactoylglutathione lyase family enzyme
MERDPVRFHHVALGLPQLADAVPVLVGVLGGVPDMASRGRGFSFACWRFDGGGQIEVLEPAGADSFLHRFLAQRGPGIHHVTFKVPSLAAACERARARGYEVVGRNESRPSWMEAFLHPRQALGIVVQFAESAAPGGPSPIALPMGPPDPPPPARVVGLRMRARAADRARVQWGEILQGEESREDGRLVYRWPRSFLRIAVEVDATADEGPLGIELTTPPRELTNGALGVTWLPTPLCPDGGEGQGEGARRAGRTPSPPPSP